VGNAAGCWAGAVGRPAGIDVPVNAMRRFEHYVELAQPLPPDAPLIKEPERLIIRPEGKGYSVGLVKSDEPRGFNLELDPAWFQDVVWPACASRVPAFEALKLKREWVGLYDENELDGNMILGPIPGRLENFHLACGFSGHGLMHAPAVGRALAELIVKGRFETIDLTPGDREVAIRFREVRLSTSLAVVHKHRFGSCRGTLTATAQGVRYETTDKDDAFEAPLLNLETFQVDYLNKNLRIQPRQGKRYDFTDPDGNADSQRTRGDHSADPPGDPVREHAERAQSRARAACATAASSIAPSPRTTGTRPSIRCG
jgi:hypothetical protein